MAGGDSDSVGVSEVFFFLRDGEALGYGLGDSEAVDDSVGLGAGDVFFFRRGEPLGVGDAVVTLFLVRVGLADAFGEVVGVGVGDFFFALEDFLRCGVGVGVEKIFLSVLPNDCSAASFTEKARQVAVIKIKVRKAM